MPTKDVIAMAREAGFYQCHVNKNAWWVYLGGIETFATRVGNAKLEEAAQAAVDAVAFNGGTVQTEAHVRQAIESLKEPTT